MVKELSLIFTLVLIGVALALIWLGWRNRLRRQSDVDPLPAIPAELGAAAGRRRRPVRRLHHRR